MIVVFSFLARIIDIRVDGSIVPNLLNVLTQLGSLCSLWEIIGIGGYWRWGNEITDRQRCRTWNLIKFFNGFSVWKRCRVCFVWRSLTIFACHSRRSYFTSIYIWLNIWPFLYSFSQLSDIGGRHRGWAEIDDAINVKTETAPGIWSQRQ